MDDRFGFIHDKLDIKILTLFILRRLPAPIPQDELSKLVLCDDGIGYFDFSECLAELVQTEHISEENGLYAITEKGERNGKITENSLPYSVRIKAEAGTSQLSSVLRRNDMIRTSRQQKEEGGWTVSLSLSDGVGDIMKIELFSATEDQVYSLEDGFKRNAEKIYNQLIQFILSDES